MTEDLEKFSYDLEELVKSFEKKLVLKMVSDPDSGVFRIYGENCSALTRARSALDEISELAYDTAEHHPYWHLLYNGSQILKIVLDKWHDAITEDELGEIQWYATKIKESLANVPDDHHHQ